MSHKRVLFQRVWALHFITNKAYHTITQVANLILDNEEEDDNAEEFIIQESGKDPLASLEPDISIQV